MNAQDVIIQQFIERVLAVTDDAKNHKLSSEELEQIAREIGLDDVDLQAIEQHVEDSFQRGRNYLKTGMLDEAIRELSEVEVFRPDDPEKMSLLLRAYAQRFSKDHEEADRLQAERLGAVLVNNAPDKVSVYRSLEMVRKAEKVRWIKWKSHLKKGAIATVVAGVVFGAAYWAIVDSNIPLTKLKDKCDSLDVVACSALATAYREGGPPVNVPSTTLAFNFSKTACELQSAKDCYAIGDAYAAGTGVTRVPYSATEFYEKACDLGYAEGCVTAGKRYSVKKNAAYMATLFKKGCELRNGDACYRLAWRQKGDVKKWYDASAEAKESLRKACEYEWPDGCNDYGVSRLKTDPERLANYMKACELGSHVGCWNVAESTHYGYGRKPNPEEAIPFYKTACTSDYSPACRVLGRRYRNGVGIDKDLVAATVYQEKACKLKDRQGCRYAGWAHQKGSGVPQSFDEAVKRYTKGCDAKDGRSCALMGKLFENGDGVEINIAHAEVLREKACQFGDKDYCKTAKPAANREELQTKCSAKDGKACLELGRDLQNTNEMHDAYAAYKKSCDLKNYGGCNAFAWNACIVGNICDVTHLDASELAANQSNSPNWINTHAHVECKIGNWKRANNSLKKACEGGHKNACAKTCKSHKVVSE